MEADVFFVPTPKDWSDECLRLMVHLHHSLTLATVAAGGSESEARGYATRFDDEDVLRNPHYARFQKLLHKMHADQPRSSTGPAHRLPSLVCYVCLPVCQSLFSYNYS